MDPEKARVRRGRARGRARQETSARRPGDEAEVSMVCLPNLGFHLQLDWLELCLTEY